MTQGVSRIRIAVILGALTAMGPLAIDTYLPALPTIARELGAASFRFLQALGGCAPLVIPRAVVRDRQAEEDATVSRNLGSTGVLYLRPLDRTACLY